MEVPLRVIDGSKAASFDGLFLEVAGISGSAESRRLAVNTLDSVVVAPAGDEWMFVVKSHKGGFGVAISAEKKAEWEHLAEEVMAAHAQITSA